MLNLYEELEDIFDESRYWRNANILSEFYVERAFEVIRKIADECEDLDMFKKVLKLNES